MPARSEAELLGQVLNLMCFAEPTSSYLADGGQIEIPEGVIVHHEVELGVIIGKPGKDISAASAFDHVAGYCVALDLCVRKTALDRSLTEIRTGRNMQEVVKKAGLPWTAAKGLDVREQRKVQRRLGTDVLPDQQLRAERSRAGSVQAALDA